MDHEQALLRGYGNLAASRLEDEGRKRPGPVGPQDLLDLKGRIKTECRDRMDRDFDGIIVMLLGKPRNLAGAIERRIDESLQMKQGEILARGANDPAGVVSPTPSDGNPSLAAHLKEPQKLPDTMQQPNLPPTSASTQTRVPLHAELKDAESRTADLKLRKMLMAVLRYNHYLEDLKVLKTACQRYQTPALLAQDFGHLDVWIAMKDDDKADIAKGEFLPGFFAWSLVKRTINLSGKNNRTLKNYRKALRAAGLL